jgi:methionyl-tRNA formyltransferase
MGPYLVKEQVINVAKYGVINTHPSLLSHNRGKNYNFWNLVEDAPFGVSLNFVDLGVDNGDIIFQKEIHKIWEDNGRKFILQSTIRNNNIV